MPSDSTKIIGYITDMSRQMTIMAMKANSPFLAYLLELAAKEGQNILNNDSNEENR
ncbi:MULTISPECIES: hypothetical protein [Bartonella]|uniref:Uncharacterized protein n=1 Tax=Bartonella choladocola TaxID=2750995 RepID=A0A1U9MHM1_9HYPH|nr:MULTISPECIES: hypothetical protein [Bartonella]AQT47405.1 hypothetical protein BBC0122_012940 [Bartonella choladocola]MBH9975569.1 hypothetical protein [Bartonella choladocola]MBI0015176.1 hypothetical protein [Bartonella sp. B10834G3]